MDELFDMRGILKDSSQNTPQKKNRIVQVVWGIAWGILIATFVFIKATGLRKVSGDSMAPTLHHGDVIITAGNLDLEELKRGDIIMFDLGKKPYRSVIKRIIGIPGDKIMASPDGISVNGVLYEDEFGTAENPDDFSGTITLGDGEYYVLGDNRSGSTDSRWFGPVRFDQIKRKFVAKLF